MNVNSRTHYGETVTALFGFGHSQFSKKVEKGLNHDDMTDLHSQQGMHHQAMAKHYASQVVGESDKAARKELRKNANYHFNMANKHKKAAQFFEKTNPNNKPSIPKPQARLPSNNPSPASAPAPMPATNLSSKPKASKPAVSPAFKAGQKVGQVADNYNNNLVKPAKTIGKSIARLWKGISPKVRSNFTKKKPDRQISKAWNTGTPRIPLPATDLAKMHGEQAAFHKNEAISAKTPEARQQHINDAKNHTNLASQWIKEASSEKPKPTAPTPEPKQEAPKAVPVEKPVKTETMPKPSKAKSTKPSKVAPPKKPKVPMVKTPKMPSPKPFNSKPKPPSKSASVKLPTPKSKAKAPVKTKVKPINPAKL